MFNGTSHCGCGLSIIHRDRPRTSQSGETIGTDWSWAGELANNPVVHAGTKGMNASNGLTEEAVYI